MNTTLFAWQQHVQYEAVFFGFSRQPGPGFHESGKQPSLLAIDVEVFVPCDECIKILHLHRGNLTELEKVTIRIPEDPVTPRGIEVYQAETGCCDSRWSIIRRAAILEPRTERST